MWAADKVWSGGGATAKFSEAANWTPSGAPGVDDTVTFNNSSAKSCTVDVNTEVKSLTFASTYTGTVDLAGATVTVNTGDFDDRYGKCLGGTSTIEFTGSEDQVLRYYYNDVFYNVENNKSGGKLVFSWHTITLNKLTVNPGTVTELSTVRTYVSDLDLQGEVGNLAVLHSSTTGTAAPVRFSGNQTVKYVDFRDIDAYCGGYGPKEIDAKDRCVDSGNNLGVLFADPYGHWDGGGADELWSTAGNWSNDTVPQTTDAVVFGGLSAKNCTIDQDISVASIVFDSSYAGTVFGGNAVITINAGDFDDSAGKFAAGTSTLKFTGSDNQILHYDYNDEFHNIENAKPNGSLTFSWHTVTIDQLTAGPGTVTKLTAGRTYLNNVNVQGADGNNAVLRSNTDGDQADVWLSGSQTLQYVTIQDVNAWGSSFAPKALNASDNCTDAGNNDNVDFGAVKVWTGAVDTAWSTGGNWQGGVAPAAGETAYFDGDISNQSCTLDTNIALKSLKMFDNYTGTLTLGTNSLTISGRFLTTNAAGQLNTTGSNVLIDGNEEHVIDTTYNQAFATLTLADSQSVRFRTRTTITDFNITAGPEVRFWDQGVEATNVNWQGGTPRLIALLPSEGKPDWDLTITGTQSIANVLVWRCNAAPGDTVDGTNGCIDLGGNTNWNFDPDEVVAKGIPSASPTSPLCVEGFRQSSCSKTVTLDNGSGPIAVNELTHVWWYGNVPLSATAPVDVQVKKDGALVVQQSVTWTPTDLTAVADISIRKADSLLLTATGAGTTLTIDADGDAVDDFAGAPGETFAFGYATPGTYTAVAKIDGNQVGTLTVTVVGIANAPPIGAMLDIERSKSFAVNPAAAADQVDLSNLPQMPMDIKSVAVIPSGIEGVFLSNSTGTGAMVARLDGEHGPILADYGMHSFAISFVTKTVNPVMKKYTDGDALVGIAMEMTPRYDGHQIRLESHSSTHVFENSGTTTFWAPTSEFDDHDQYNYYMISGDLRYNACHSAIDVREE